MASKKFQRNDTRPQTAKPEIPEAEAGKKLPIDTTGTGSKMLGFQEIPVTMLHPFSLKNGADYSRHNEVLSERFVESIKAVGVLETLIVRPSPITMGMYEIIAGESRWEHAKTAGLETVPCRVMNLDDNGAKDVFHLTNVLRRDMTPRDKINGWYDYYTRFKARSSAVEDIEEALEEGTNQMMNLIGGKGLSLRSIQRYVKMHDLIEEWLVKLDEDAVNQRIAERIAFFPPEIQKELLLYNVNNETKIRWLYKVYKGKDTVTWYDGILADHLELLGAKKEKQTPTHEERVFKKATPKMIEAVRSKLRPSDYSRGDEVITKALELYYAQIDKPD